MGDDNKFKDSPREQKNNFSDSPREVKKKVETIAIPSASASTVNPLSSPSVSEGGTSGLEITPSASQNIPNLPGRVNPQTLAPINKPIQQVPEPAVATQQKPIVQTTEGEYKPELYTVDPNKANMGRTALGENLEVGQKDLGTITTYSGQKLGGQTTQFTQNIIAKKREDEETKKISDFHDKVYLPQALAKGIQPNSHQADIDFYLEYVKQNDPEEFKYLSQKHASLKGTVADDIKSGEDKEDTQEDKLALERFQAELLTKATALKTRANQGSYKMAENNIKNYYQDKLKSYTDLSKSMETDLNQFNAINDELGTYPKNEQGQIITDTTNRKKVEELIKKQQEILSGLQVKNGQLDEIKGDKDFNDAMKTLDETQSNYESVSKRYYDLASNNPEAFKALPEYKALLERKKKAKEEKDYKENVLGVTSFGVEEGAGRAMTGIISSLAYLPKSLTSNSEYGWTDKLSDIASNNIDDFNDEYIATPTEMDKPLLEDGKWNLKYLPGKVAQTATDMAIMIAITKGVGTGAGALTRGALSREAAASLGSIVSGYTMSANGYYQEAKEAGMSDKEATSFSRTLAIQQALLELVSPNEKLLSPSLIKNDVKEFSKILAKGASGTQAAKQLATSLIKKNVPEISQELLQTLDEHVNKFSSAELSKANENVRQSLGEQMVETAILTALTTTMLGGATGDFTGQKGKMQKQALYMAAYAPDKTIQALNKMYANDQITQEQLNEMSQKIQVASESLSKMGNIPQEKKINALWAQYDKDLLQNEASKTDPIYQEPINQKIAEKEQEIQQILNEPSEEELTNDRIVELQDLESVGLINESEKSELKELLTIKQSKNVQEEKSKAEVLNEPSLQEEGKMFEVDATEQRQPIELSVETPKVEAAAPVVKEEDLSTVSSEDIERRRQEELKERVVYDRFPTVEDGEFKIIGDPNNRIYRINETTGRPQELDESNGLWSNTALSPNLFMESTKRSGFEKSKNKINAKYDAEIAALKNNNTPKVENATVKEDVEKTFEDKKDELEKKYGKRFKNEETYHLITGGDGNYYIKHEDRGEPIKTYKFQTEEQAKKFSEKEGVELLTSAKQGVGFTSENRSKYDTELAALEEAKVAAPVVKEEVKPTPKVEAPTKKEEAKPEVKEVELEARFPGGMPRKMEFKDGEWKQNVGGDYTAVAKQVQEQAQEAFDGVKTEVKKEPSKSFEKPAVAEVTVPEVKAEIIPEVKKEGNDLVLMHGSPHDFDKFQLEKIGTGEGNQAFGYGLYFTGSSKIAKAYANKLSEDKTGTVYEVKIKDGAKKEWIEWRQPLEQSQEDAIFNSLTEEEKKQYEEHLDKAFYPDSKNYDSNYEKDYTGSFGDLKRDELGLETYDKPSAVGNIYQDLKDAFGQEKASDIFKRAGVDGIRYKSNKGRGSDYNYVVFDPNSIEITKKSNGKTLEQVKTSDAPTKKGQDLSKKEVELEPIFTGGMPRKMEFKDGEWKLLAGDEYTKVAPAVQQQAQEAFDKLQTKTEENVNQENEQWVPSEKPIGEESIKTEPKQTTSGKETSTSGVLQAQEEVKPVEKPKSEPVSKKQELVDEEEVADAKKQESKEVLDSLDKDIAALKQTKDKLLAEKKVQGALYRAYKAKEEGKIKKSTYTAFRNTIEEVAGPKVNTDKAKAKMHLSLIKDKVKERLLGEGFKNVAMSAPGVNPKVVEDIIDATFGLMDRAIDAGFAIRQSVETAARLIKNTAAYKAAIRNGIIKEGELDSEIQKALVEKEKELEEAAKKEKESKVEEKKSEQPSIFSEERKTSVHVDRIIDNPKYKNVVDNMGDNPGEYNVTSIKLVEDYIDGVIKEYEKNDLVVDLALELSKPKNESMMHPEVMSALQFKLAEKLNDMSMQEGVEEMTKSSLQEEAAKLFNIASKSLSQAAKITKVTGTIGKNIFQKVSSNPKMTEIIVKEKIKNAQDSQLSKQEKSNIKDAAKEINSILDAEVEASEEAAKKEKKSKRKFNKKSFDSLIDSLKTDLSDC